MRKAITTSRENELGMTEKVEIKKIFGMTLQHKEKQFRFPEQSVFDLFHRCPLRHLPDSYDGRMYLVS